MNFSIFNEEQINLFVETHSKYFLFYSFCLLNSFEGELRWNKNWINSIKILEFIRFQVFCNYKQLSSEFTEALMFFSSSFYWFSFVNTWLSNIDNNTVIAESTSLTSKLMCVDGGSQLKSLLKLQLVDTSVLYHFDF